MRILYIDLDALTPSHLSCYGYPRQSSPTIDAIAAQGVRCTNVYCSDAPCLPSRTAFYQGRFGIQTGVVGHGGTAADVRTQGAGRAFKSEYEIEAFPYALQRAGFHTAMISPFGQRHAAHQFYAGFHEIHNTGFSGMESAEQVQPTVEKWLSEHAAQDNWYLHLNFWDIHTPYRVPLDYGNPFENDPLPDWMTPAMVETHMAKTGPHSAQDLAMYGDLPWHDKYPRLPQRITDMQTLKEWIDGYDTAIRYVDDQIARIVAMLQEAGVYQDTAIILSADHGENQGELGIYGEHATADHATCNVPMIVRWPGGDGTTLQPGHVDHTLHYHLDWAPTCLALLGQSARTPAQWDGQSFASTLLEGRDAGREDLIISQCAHVCQRSVRFGPWLYIRTYHDGFHLFPRDMLFDLEKDPHEQNDLAAEHPQIVQEGIARLANWHDQQMLRLSERMEIPTDPLWTVMAQGGPYHANFTVCGNPGSREKFEAYLSHLETSGRSEGARLLRKRFLESQPPIPVGPR